MLFHVSQWKRIVSWNLDGHLFLILVVMATDSHPSVCWPNPSENESFLLVVLGVCIECWCVIVALRAGGAGHRWRMLHALWQDNKLNIFFFFIGGFSLRAALFAQRWQSAAAEVRWQRRRTAGMSCSFRGEKQERLRLSGRSFSGWYL